MHFNTTVSTPGGLKSSSMARHCAACNHLVKRAQSYCLISVSKLVWRIHATILPVGATSLVCRRFKPWEYRPISCYGPADKTSPDEIEQQMQKAQECLEQAARDVAERSAKLTTEHLGDLQIYGSAGPRATLGMRVRPTANGSTDGATGVQIVSVSPGVPRILPDSRPTM